MHASEKITPKILKDFMNNEHDQIAFLAKPRPWQTRIRIYHT